MTCNNTDFKTFKNILILILNNTILLPYEWFKWYILYSKEIRDFWTHFPWIKSTAEGVRVRPQFNNTNQTIHLNMCESLCHKPSWFDCQQTPQHLCGGNDQTNFAIVSTQRCVSVCVCVCLCTTPAKVLRRLPGTLSLVNLKRLAV